MGSEGTQLNQLNQREHERFKNPKNPIKERMEYINRLKEILEFDAVNQMVKPLYELTRKPPEKPPPDDTLARLEALQQPPKPLEFYKNLIGAAYQLDKENKEYLIVLTDGVIMKIAAPDSAELLRYFKVGFSDKKEKAELNLLKQIKESPTLNLGMYGGTLVYRTDDPNLTPEAVRELVSKDWEKAQEMKFNLLKRREENITAGMEGLGINSRQDESNKERPSSE